MQNSVDGTSIASIIEIDKKARQRLEQAKLEAQKIIDIANQRKVELEREYNRASDERLEKIGGEYRSKAEGSLSEIELRSNEKMDKLRQAMEQNRERWEKEIISEIIG